MKKQLYAAPAIKSEPIQIGVFGNYGGGGGGNWSPVHVPRRRRRRTHWPWG